jgi:hypothetical protein
MSLSFLRGDADRPRGHALVAFRKRVGSDDAFVTYAVVLPIVVDPMKYLPPAFASQFQGMAGALQGLDAVPMPPVPEAMTISTATRLAARRDDDLVDAGVTDGSPMNLMHMAQQAVRQYAEAYRAAGERADAVIAEPSGSEGDGATAIDAPDDDALRWFMMDERARIDEMTRLVGRLRDAVERNIHDELGPVTSLMSRLAATLPPKYRASELVTGASRPGREGRRLAELYLDRCYRLFGEQYEGLAEIDREIAKLDGSSG